MTQVWHTLKQCHEDRRLLADELTRLRQVAAQPPPPPPQTLESYFAQQAEANYYREATRALRQQELARRYREIDENWRTR